MFLLPQHFQQNEAHFTEAIAASSRIDHAYSYGYFHWELDADALQVWRIEVRRLVGRTKSGLQFAFQSGEVPSLDLRMEEYREVQERLAGNEEVPVYLAFPGIRPNEDNVSLQGRGRYREFEQPILDIAGGDNERSIVLKALCPQLHFAADKTADFDYLPLGKLALTAGKAPVRGDAARAATGGPGLGFVPDYWPPCTLSRAHPEARAWLEKATDRLEAYLRRLADYFQLSGTSTLNFADPEQSRFMQAFQVLSELRAWLQVHNRSAGVDPLTVHFRLCQTIGALVWVDPKQEWLPNTVSYEHEDLFRSWATAWKRIEQCFVEPSLKDIRQFPLIAARMNFEDNAEIVFKTAIDSSLFAEDWRFYIGIFFAKMSPQDTEELLGKLPKFFDSRIFDWKMGTESEVERIFSNREPGVMPNNGTRSKEKPNLPRQKGWLFYDIERHPGWDAWESVRREGNVCLRVVPQNLRVGPEALGGRDITVAIQGKTYRFQLSIWAVREPER